MGSLGWIGGGIGCCWRVSVDFSRFFPLLLFAWAFFLCRWDSGCLICMGFACYLRGWIMLIGIDGCIEIAG